MHLRAVAPEALVACEWRKQARSWLQIALCWWPSTGGSSRLRACRALYPAFWHAAPIPCESPNCIIFFGMELLALRTWGMNAMPACCSSISGFLFMSERARRWPALWGEALGGQMSEWTVCASRSGLKRGWQPPNFHGGGAGEGKGFPGGASALHVEGFAYTQKPWGPSQA